MGIVRLLGFFLVFYFIRRFVQTYFKVKHLEKQMQSDPQRTKAREDDKNTFEADYRTID